MSFREGFGNLDGTADFSRVDTTHSEGIIQDARQLVCQSRSNGNTYLTEACASLGAWTVHTGGTASVTQETTGEGGTDNPSGTSSFTFSTGATLNSYCAANLTLASLPASYGVWIETALTNVSTSPEDAFQLAIQNTVDGRVLNLMFYSGQISVGDSSGAFHSLGTHDPAYGCEDWIENRDNGDGTNTVSLYQGSQLMACQTVTMLTQSNPGMVYWQQQSGATANQQTQILGLNIGATQLPDAGLLQSIPYTVPYNAQAANVHFHVEDVCADVVLNTDFTAALIHNGVETAFTLIDDGTGGKGIIDYTKNVRIFGATIAETIAQGDTLAYKCHMLNGKFMAVLAVLMQPVSIY